MSWRAILSGSVRELRFCICPKGESSSGARKFFSENYGDLKHLNPATAILLRGAEGIAPRVTACYDFGKEETVNLTDMTAEEVEKKVEALVKQGASMPKSGEYEKFTAWII